MIPGGPMSHLSAPWVTCTGITESAIVTPGTLAEWEERVANAHGHREPVDTCRICRDLRLVGQAVYQAGGAVQVFPAGGASIRNDGRR